MIRIRQIKVPVLENHSDFLMKQTAHILSISKDDIISFHIVHQSIDARDRSNVFYVYEVEIECLKEKQVLNRNRKNSNVFFSTKQVYSYQVSGESEIPGRIIIVGSGPSGLFCAYMLAEAGFKPLILEQGEKMEERIQSVEHFFQTGQLNPLSNVQFGEGGAGTFSDGKLNTLVKDKVFRGKKVFEIFVENGAPEEILYQAKPHIGTDLLRDVIIRMRNKILSMGGEFWYSSQLTDIIVTQGKITSIEINHEVILPCGVLVLAIGHSARETFLMLSRHSLLMKPKNFAVGVRMEHLQEMINRSQYGDFSDVLPPASYKLTYQSKSGRGVYSFCMCPGGFVVNASSEEGRLAINGMSYHNRDGKNANSALVVTVGPKDFGNTLFGGMEFQRKLEKKAYSLGSGKIPVQLYQDFVENRVSTSFGSVRPNTKGDYTFSNLNELFPREIRDSLCEAIDYFGRKIQGFDRGDSLLLGVESRTSSPVMIVRDEFGVSSIDGIYPCGEGAGYAGGITTAAMDGLYIFEMIGKRYHS